MTVGGTTTCVDGVVSSFESILCGGPYVDFALWVVRGSSPVLSGGNTTPDSLRDRIESRSEFSVQIVLGRRGSPSGPKDARGTNAGSTTRAGLQAAVLRICPRNSLAGGYPLHPEVTPSVKEGYVLSLEGKTHVQHTVLHCLKVCWI